MASSFSISVNNFIFKTSYPLYKVMNKVFKKKQDAFEISLLQTHIKPGDVVIDIGANIGFYSELISTLVGKTGRVHSFEPDIINFKHLKNRTKKIENVSVYNKAVAEKNHIIKIYTSKILNTYHRTYKPDDFDQEIDIEAVALDNNLKEHVVDFIKIDIQGFEMNAMNGMTNLLKSPDLKILSAFWPYGLKKAGSNILEYFLFLKQYNFHVYLIEHHSLIPLSEAKVKAYMNLPEKEYMNIFASKTHV